MKRLHRSAKTDANQAEIVAALRAHGCQVLSLAQMGGGCPDLLVWSPRGFVGRDVHPGGNLLMEVKDGSKPPSARKLTPDQVKFHAWWPGEIHIVNDVDEALRAAGITESS